MNKTTKYLIPVEKPGQFDPIPITGIWEYVENEYVGNNKLWICHDATPYCYNEMKINERALVDHI